ncbi:hypothetical protein K449DRAFT_439599 [Hypoxylon sp. EC38]|nr:hypothetical protein K449DRAFT_439599 [Hypoxylon sp. EC38]
MDHIPRPVNSVIPHLEVPFLDIIPYQLGHFDDFWRIAGFERTTSDSPINEVTPGSLDHNQDSDFISGYGNPPSGLARDRSVMDYARLVQSWLYFGLLSEYTGKVVNPLDLLHVTPDNKRLVRSQKFIASDNMRLSISQNLMEILGQRRARLLKRARAFLDQISGISYATQDPLPLILLSVSVLLGSLQESLQEETRGLPYWLKRGQLQARMSSTDSLYCLEQGLPQTRLLTERMSSTGWCPRHISRICGTLRSEVAYFVSLLNRHERPGIDHSPCSETSCMANDVNEETYETFHVSQDCPCSMIGVDEAQLAEIIRQGKIPIVRIERDQTTNRPTLKLIATSASNRYIAVSHVWADGLGNPRSNSLPQCQIERLSRRISALPKGNKPGTSFSQTYNFGRTWANWVPATSEDSQQKPRCFWIDTLCVPIMNYSNSGWGLSRSVITWPISLLAIGTQGVGRIKKENWVDPATSSVQTVLSTPVFCVSNDIPATQWKLRYHLRNRLLTVPDLWPNKHGWISYLVPYANTHSPNLARTWNELVRRSTTKADDLYLILCNLIGRKTYQLKGLKSNSERMAAIISSCETIPQAFLYNRGTRCLENEDHLDRWLPTAVNGSDLSHSPPLVVKEDSLYANPAGLQPILLLPPTKLEGTYSLFTKEDTFICNIEAHRPIDDRFQVDRNRYVATGILLEKDIRAYYGQIRGACVHVASIKDSGSDDPIFLSVVYDCPVTAVQSFTPKTGIGDNDSPKIYIDRFVQKCNLQIKREPLLFQHRLSRRRNDANSHPTVSIIPLVLWTATGIRALTSLDNSVPDFIFYLIFFCAIVPFVSAPILVPLYIYTIVHYPTMQNRGRFLAFVISQWITIIIFTIYEFIWVPHAYNVWVASFAEEPVPWYKSFNIGSRRWRAIFRQRRRDLPSQPNDIEMQSTNNQV